MPNEVRSDKTTIDCRLVPDRDEPVIQSVRQRIRIPEVIALINFISDAFWIVELEDSIMSDKALAVCSKHRWLAPNRSHTRMLAWERTWPPKPIAPFGFKQSCSNHFVPAAQTKSVAFLGHKAWPLFGMLSLVLCRTQILGCDGLPVRREN
jgi:hypothetical protein